MSPVVVTETLQAFFDRVEWMAAIGFPPDGITAQLGMRPETVRRIYERCERPLPAVLQVGPR